MRIFILSKWCQGDDNKYELILGVYSTFELAQQALEHSSIDEDIEDFEISNCEMDVLPVKKENPKEWEESFIDPRERFSDDT